MKNATAVWIDSQAAPSKDSFSAQVGFVCPVYRVHRFDEAPDSLGPGFDSLLVGSNLGAKNADEQLIPALSFIKANLAAKITLEAVAEVCGLGRYQFSRAFKGAYGTTFREFLITQRIWRATQMLCSNTMSITDVAFSVGFNDLSHFTQMFRRYVGVRPSDYVRRTKRDIAPISVLRTSHSKEIGAAKKLCFAKES